MNKRVEIVRTICAVTIMVLAFVLAQIDIITVGDQMIATMLALIWAK